ncbi:MAG TPA: hypothetical protein VIW21_02265 [Chthoniobacterales bacterium]
MREIYYNRSSSIKIDIPKIFENFDPLTPENVGEGANHCMKTNYLAIVAAIIVGFSAGPSRIHAGDDKKEIEKKMVDEAKKAADKPEEGHTNYDVKKSHDEHIPATEKAAADATKKDESKK